MVRENHSCFTKFRECFKKKEKKSTVNLKKSVPLADVLTQLEFVKCVQEFVNLKIRLIMKLKFFFLES